MNLSPNKGSKLVPGIIISVIIFLGSTSNGYRLNASSNNSDSGQPDEDCLFEPSLPKCAPGPEGCPQGFAMNSYEQCFPKHEVGCPKGYHSHEDDESGRCISDSVPCDDGYLMNPNYPECQFMEHLCKKLPTINDCIYGANAFQNTSSRAAYDNS